MKEVREARRKKSQVSHLCSSELLGPTETPHEVFSFSPHMLPKANLSFSLGDISGRTPGTVSRVASEHK